MGTLLTKHLIFRLVVIGVVLAILPTQNVFAARVYNDNYENVCSTIEGRFVDEPSPLAILCPIAKLFNVILLSSAAVFVIFIFMTSIKYAMAQGDPKALQGSKQSLTFAIIGFIVVIGSYTALTIIKNVLGLSDNPIIDPFRSLNDGLVKLFLEMGFNKF